MITERVRETARADHEVAYWLGCFCAGQGLRDEAMEWLRRSVFLGNEDYVLFRGQPHPGPSPRPSAVRGVRRPTSGRAGSGASPPRAPPVAVTAPKELLERIQLRLEDSFTGIGEVVGDMPSADVADLVNQLTHRRGRHRAHHAAGAARGGGLRPADHDAAGGDPGEPRPPPAPPRSSKGWPRTSAPTSSSSMGERDRRKLLPLLRADVRAEVERLCQYPDHSAGGIMTTEFVRLDPTMTGRRRPQAHPRGGPRQGVDLRLLRARARHGPAAGLALPARPRDGRPRASPSPT